MQDETVRPSVHHYQQGGIEPIDFISSHDLDFYSANIVKYATRWPYKGQARSDIQKIIHYAEMLLEDDALIEKRCARPK